MLLSLHFLTEADTYLIINRLAHLVKSQSDRKYFTPGKKGILLFLHTFNSLVKIRARPIYDRKFSTYSHQDMKSINVDYHKFDEWFLRLFVGNFPHQTVLRIFDVFLNEGGKVLYRVALAFLKMNKAELLGCTTEEEFLQVLKVAAAKCKDPDSLIKV